MNARRLALFAIACILAGLTFAMLLDMMIGGAA